MHRYTPGNILQYIYEQHKDSEFLMCVMNHRRNYSIGEIPDRQFIHKNGEFQLKSRSYNLNLKIEDDQVQTAILNHIYITPFLSRHDDSYQVHFLVHQYLESMKSQFEEEIMQDVVRYMILKTVIGLRLDTPGKVDEYLEGK